MFQKEEIENNIQHKSQELKQEAERENLKQLLFLGFGILAKTVYKHLLSIAYKMWSKKHTFVCFLLTLKDEV